MTDMIITRRFPILAATLFVLALCGCKDDVYEPGKIRPIPPAENPFGEGFKAASGLNWSLCNTLKLNVAVHDEFDGRYKYLIEVFTVNPLVDNQKLPIATGYANQMENYTTEITVPQGTERIYLRQTDPKARRKVFEFEASEQMTCKLFYDASDTQTRALADTRTTPPNPLDIPVYEEEKASEEAIEVTEESYPYGLNVDRKDDRDYVIRGNYTKDITIDGSDTRVFITGECYPNSITLRNGGSGSLIVNSGATLNCANIWIDQRHTLLNYGTINDSGSFTLQNAPATVYNNGIMNLNDFTMNNRTNLYNLQSITVSGNGSAQEANIVNQGSLTFEKAFYTFARIDNYGTLQAMSSNNWEGLQGTGNGFTLVNYEGANVNVGYLKLDNNSQIFNYHTINAVEIDAPNNGLISNNCHVIISQKLKCRNISLSKGVITGEWSGDHWSGVPVVEGQNLQLTLDNGSALFAEEMTLSNGTDIIATGEETSLLKIARLANYGRINARGNLVISIDQESQRGDIQLQQGAYSDRNSPNEPNIDTCTGSINQASPGTPEDNTQDAPENLDKEGDYTYAFEDQWPVYGDYDMNDVVLTLNQVRLKVKNNGGDVQEAILSGEIKAVGASRTLGVGLQFIGLDNEVTKIANVKSATENNVSFESGNYYPTLIITEDVHRFLNPRQSDNSFINVSYTEGYQKGAVAWEYQIKFAGHGVSPEAFNIDKLDFFIFTQKGAYVPYRREVHIANYAPTLKADQSYSGASNDNGSGCFISQEGLAWGIRIPTSSWRWPQERIIITDVYYNFDSWVTSGYNNSWWRDNINYGNLY
ncbi:MAG: LruC domain-containing protein [Bacteroides sp.]